MIIVIGGIKGGTGKSTLAIHIACALLEEKFEIATYDLDYPQFSFDRFYKNRRNSKLNLWENHQFIKDFKDLKIENDEKIHIIDTPGRYDENLIEIHKMADIIITPINDSFIDIDTIMETDRERWGKLGSYYEMIFENKKQKPNSMWIVVRNRSSSINSTHKKNVEEKLEDLSRKLEFKVCNGLKERNIFRELYTKGQTVFDIKSKLAISHIAAKLEIKILAQEIKKYLKTIK